MCLGADLSENTSCWQLRAAEKWRTLPAICVSSAAQNTSPGPCQAPAVSLDRPGGSSVPRTRWQAGGESSGKPDRGARAPRRRQEAAGAEENRELGRYSAGAGRRRHSGTGLLPGGEPGLGTRRGAGRLWAPAMPAIQPHVPATNTRKVAGFAIDSVTFPDTFLPH
ncbi:hypothetical protein chiPu_0011820 [Chiloscyllium punctatum]|uniref:Uncharacterized protein n=1 Tax=Chiloscyllium punctatum TaxID=137246 RepID=A0A401SSI7_CHIPU|nr:hypothetical protein [Chiloscyllium punctatum]